MSLFSKWFGSKERRILILGLDGAGTYLNTLHSNMTFKRNMNLKLVLF